MLTVGSLSSHLMTQHGRAAGKRRQWITPAAGSGPHSYRISFPENRGPHKCLVEGCPGRVVTRTAMRVNFVHWHVLDVVVILEEVKFPHPRCARCDMQVPRRALNGGGGILLLPESPRCRGHASAQSSPALPSSSRLSPGTPPQGIYVVPHFPERKSGNSGDHSPRTV